MTYEEALRYLDTFVNYEKREGYDYERSFRLDRMRRLASEIGDPQKSFKSIHIAGTKGKGSTSAITYSILKEAGFKTGLYTSPHLISFRERIAINGELITEGDVARHISQIRPAVEKMRDDVPTLFEVCTALAYLYFKEKAVDFAVFETGLGGRLDATNILAPLVACITPISYEHTDKLGNTLTSIASEKAGIIKDDSICVIAPQETEALDAIIKICGQKRAKAILIGRDVKFEELKHDDSSEVFKVDGLVNEYPALTMSLLGAHQIVNAATAVGIVEALSMRGIRVGKDAVERGIACAKWPGRMEVAARRPLIVLDGAQNRASANALAIAVRRAFRYERLFLVLGVSGDKDIKGILDELLPLADEVFLTKAKMKERAADPERIRSFIPPDSKNIHITGTVAEAVDSARSSAGPEDLVLIAGSLFVVGEAKQLRYE